jgi:EAL domain-containing protein (putative c-di-GMP-specific phosphodiesterase class I)
VSGLGVDPEDAAITNAVITLSHTLGLVAIAEGVESPLQRDELVRLGCDQAQGFLLGRPMNPADLADFLISRGPPPIG